MTKVFIDGSAGTTGLRIRERLLARTDLELLTLPEDRRKDLAARAAAVSVLERIDDGLLMEAVEVIKAVCAEENKEEPA